MNYKTKFLLIAAASLLTLQARASDLTEATGIKDACTTGATLDANHIPYKVVVCGGQAGCIYEVNGTSYLYTLKGSAKINPEQMDKVPLQRVSREEVFRISDGSRQIKNGCLVFATCTYSQYKRNPQIAWAGIIAAQIVNVNNLGGDTSFSNLTGHAITAFETDKKEIFIQEDGLAPRKVDSMTKLAQRGDKSWYDPSGLIYCDHHIQGITTFKDQFGKPL